MDKYETKDDHEEIVFIWNVVNFSDWIQSFEGSVGVKRKEIFTPTNQKLVLLFFLDEDGHLVFKFLTNDKHWQVLICIFFL